MVVRLLFSVLESEPNLAKNPSQATSPSPASNPAPAFSPLKISNPETKETKPYFAYISFIRIKDLVAKTIEIIWIMKIIP